MSDFACCPSRRTALLLLAAALSPVSIGRAAERPAITVHKDPSCGCCNGWVRHLQRAGFVTHVIETNQTDAVKRRFGVPDDLASCHTAEVGGYVVEGHVPVSAVQRLLAERPQAIGLAVPGMPVGSPGMEGSTPEPYEVVLFGRGGRQTYMRFVGDRAV